MSVMVRRFDISLRNLHGATTIKTTEGSRVLSLQMEPPGGDQSNVSLFMLCPTYGKLRKRTFKVFEPYEEVGSKSQRLQYVGSVFVAGDHDGLVAPSYHVFEKLQPSPRMRVGGSRSAPISPVVEPIYEDEDAME